MPYRNALPSALPFKTKKNQKRITIYYFQFLNFIKMRVKTNLIYLSLHIESCFTGLTIMKTIQTNVHKMKDQ